MAILDLDVAEWLGRATLTTMKRGNYLALRIDGEMKYLHRVIMDCPADMVVDHFNGNGFDNRRSNLRICSRAENIRHRVKLNRNNSSGKRGVYKDGDRWVAEIKMCRKKIFLGSFKTFEEAVKSRTKAELRLFKDYRGLV